MEFAFNLIARHMTVVEAKKIRFLSKEIRRQIDREFWSYFLYRDFGIKLCNEEAKEEYRIQEKVKEFKDNIHYYGLESDLDNLCKEGFYIIEDYTEPLPVLFFHNSKINFCCWLDYYDSDYMKNASHLRGSKIIYEVKSLLKSHPQARVMITDNNKIGSIAKNKAVWERLIKDKVIKCFHDC